MIECVCSLSEVREYSCEGGSERVSFTRESLKFKRERDRETDRERGRERERERERWKEEEEEDD